MATDHLHRTFEPRSLPACLRILSAPQIRNVAIIAHVDHGKTTLVDGLLRQSASGEKLASTDRVMDSNALEQVRA